MMLQLFHSISLCSGTTEIVAFFLYNEVVNDGICYVNHLFYFADALFSYIALLEKECLIISHNGSWDSAR